MIQCPECRSMIPDDSAFCDQCGKELKWCPECKKPKRGTECPVCGSDLVPGRKYLASSPSPSGEVLPPQAGPRSGPLPSGDGPLPLHPRADMASGGSTFPDGGPQPTTAAVAGPVALVGNGWRLMLQQGEFGRSCGIWPELSTCPYVSGHHGFIEGHSGGWKISDRGSTNGTFINGRKLATAEQYELKKGDRVRIATLDFTVE